MSSRAVAAYADAFNRRFTTAPGVASPLGAWLLLALVAPVASGERRARLEEVLGVEADRAAAYAERLVADAPDAVLAAVAVWSRVPGLLPVGPAVEQGPVPDQDGADAWTRRATAGLVDRYPLPIPPDAGILLTSALVARVAWERPLDVDADGHLVLRHGRGWQTIVDTDAAGPVVVACPHSPGDLRVLSVAAAPGVDPGDVHRAAHEVALPTTSPRLVEPSVDGFAWTVTQRHERRASHSDVVVEHTSTLPAWELRSRHDLAEAPGVADALEVLGSLLPPGGVQRSAAVQAAVASYTATGFEAAAVTAMGRAGSASPPVREVLVRDVRLDLVRPHAVIAVADRLPVFSAWVDPVTS